MRRLLAVAVLVTALAVSACSADRPAGEGTAVPTAAGPGATSAGSTGTPSAGDAQVCAESQRAGTTAVRVYVEELGRMVAAVGAGDSATAEAARVRAEAALAQWRTTLREQSARAADPQLRTLLNDMGTEVAALGVDGESIDETELDRLQQRLDQLCVR
ncbi:hypothetical protein ADK66_16025 [Micromonospora sp. NRRL B-16802]|uniref:hypothetical protein n=1 Tax=Micromonospora sp. NRRL B-16802 TaxID=1415541 RepID=UPI0006AF0930|nr:hypothetical protein [Micromonospora sp. NRRL B-16802]KOX08339.1 hypothetical protein ADK66_16025 [Micromonospora sp. NRRL B-16802]